jgi:hypothetical protein
MRPHHGSGANESAGANAASRVLRTSSPSCCTIGRRRRLAFEPLDTPTLPKQL